MYDNTIHSRLANRYILVKSSTNYFNHYHVKITQYSFTIYSFDAKCNRRVSQMRALLAACRELAVDYDTLLVVLHIFEHKT